MSNASSMEKLIRLLEEQLIAANEQNEKQSKQIEKQTKQIEKQTKQIESLTKQVQQLTKLLFGSKSEKSKYQAPDGQCSLFEEEDDNSFTNSELPEEQSQQLVTASVERRKVRKKRNDCLRDDVETEIIHHHPKSTSCMCCKQPMAEIGYTIVREEAKFIPAVMKKIQHAEHAYECTHCKRDSSVPSQIVRGKAPQPAIQRSAASASVLAKLIYDKFIQYLPLYRQVQEWERYGLLTNDKNLSNWVIHCAANWLKPIYDLLKAYAMRKTLLHVDETYGKIIERSDGKSGQSNAYNWVLRSSPSQGPVIALFHSSLSRARAVLKELTEGFKGTIVCDGYSAYADLDDVEFANCWAHVRRYWLKVDSKNGRIGVEYCDRLYRLERKFKRLSPGKRRKMRKKHSRPIVDEFLNWIDQSMFVGSSALATASNYTLKHRSGLRKFLDDGRIEIDNNPAENAIRPSVIGRKNWLFSFSEAGAQANAICLSLAETAKANGIDFYAYLEKLLSELPNLDFHRQPELLDAYLPWSKNIQATCGK